MKVVAFCLIQRQNFALFSVSGLKEEKLIKKHETCKLYSSLLNIWAIFHQNRSSQFRAIPFQSRCVFWDTLYSIRCICVVTFGEADCRALRGQCGERGRRGWERMMRRRRHNQLRLTSTTRSCWSRWVWRLVALPRCPLTCPVYRRPWCSGSSDADASRNQPGANQSICQSPCHHHCHHEQ